MKTMVLLLISAAAMLVTAGCESEHEHHGHYGGAYEGTHRQFGHEQWPGYPSREGYWDRSDDWHPH